MNFNGTDVIPNDKLYFFLWLNSFPLAIHVFFYSLFDRSLDYIFYLGCSKFGHWSYRHEIPIQHTDFVFILDIQTTEIAESYYIPTLEDLFYFTYVFLCLHLLGCMYMCLVPVEARGIECFWSWRCRKLENAEKRYWKQNFCLCRSNTRNCWTISLASQFLKFWKLSILLL